MEPTLVLLILIMCLYVCTFLMFGYWASGYYHSADFHDDTIIEEASDGSNEEQVEDFIVDIENRHPNLT